MSRSWCLERTQQIHVEVYAGGQPEFLVHSWQGIRDYPTALLIQLPVSDMVVTNLSPIVIPVVGIRWEADGKRIDGMKEQILPGACGIFTEVQAIAILDREVLYDKAGGRPVVCQVRLTTRPY